MLRIQNSGDTLTPGAQMAFWTPFFPFGLKLKPLLRRHVMISLKTFALETKTMISSFTKSIYIFDIFYHFYQFELRISEVWKGKILCALGVKYIFHKNTLNLPYVLHPEFQFLRIDYPFRKFTMNSIMISRIRHLFTIFTAKLLYLHYLFREFTIN